MKRIFALALTLAILFAFMTGCSFFEDPFDRGEIAPPNENQNNIMGIPSISGGLDFEVISSIDRLNYYAALYVLGDDLAPNKSAMLRSGISPLAEYDEDAPEENGWGESTEPGDQSNTTTSQENVYYYALSPNDVFSFDKISMFQIELTDENGFLASKLGLGTVDVVITEECIWDDGLITFRNGENFFSCLTNGVSYDPQTGATVWDFSTHKFVEGFYIVKNLDQENYSFNIEIDANGQATKFTCTESEKGGPRADKNVKVVSDTNVSTAYRSFTLAELEAYFKQQDHPSDPEASENV